MKLNEHGLWDWCASCHGKPKQYGQAPCPSCRALRRKYPGFPKKADWALEHFDEWSELTKERDGDRADAEAQQRRSPYDY
jgi:hypothetical protein|tara:strand:+ start:466 stop:705 length:240 start_codon:yes stop_codon:yes gene_type:complete